MATSSSFGEHLAALVVVGQGLQIRVHRLHTDLHTTTTTTTTATATAKNNSRAMLFKDAELDKLRKSLDKNFPKRELAAKEKGWDKLNEHARAQQLCGELAPHYQCLKECAKFRDTVLSALRRAPGSILRDPRGSVPTEEQFWPGLASRNFLDLVCVFGRLHIQLERLGGDMRALVAVYNAAHFALHSEDEDDFSAVLVPFTKLFEEGHQIVTNSSNTPASAAAAAALPGGSPILRSLVADLVRNDESVADLVSYLLEKVRHWFVSGTNKDHNVWQMNVFACALNTSEPSQQSDVSRCAPVCFREQARSWVVWGLLLLPSALASSRTKYSETARLESLLRHVLSENIVEQVVREHTLRLHDEFYYVFAYFPGKQPQFAAVKERFVQLLTAKPKKLVNESAVECGARAAAVHRERRVILAQLLLSAVTFVRAHPASVGPKLASVVALLAASKDELSWYLAHHRCAAPRVHSTGVMNNMFLLGAGTGGEPVKFSREEWASDSVRVGVLLSMHTALFEHARQAWWIGEQYSSEVLRGPMLGECLRRGLSEHAAALQQNIEQQWFELKLLELRNETYVQPSTGSMYSSCSGYGDEFLPQLFFHLVLVEDDGLGADPPALRHFASLANVAVFSPHVQELFEDMLREQPRHCLGYFDLLSSAQDVLNAHCPEEFPVVGELVCALADQVLFRIQNKLVEALDELQAERYVLEAQIDPMKAVDRLLFKQSQKIQQQQFQQQQQQQFSPNSSLQQQQQPSSSAAAASTGSKLDFKPGFESKPRYRDHTSKLAKAQRAVRGICASLGRDSANSVLVWNRTYSLREYLRETLTQWLDGKLRGALLAYKPSLLLAHHARTFDTVRFACEHGGFDAALLIRQAWLKETTEGGGASTLDVAKQAIAQFLDGGGGSKLSSSLYVYSDFTRSFERASPPASSSSSSSSTAASVLGGVVAAAAASSHLHHHLHHQDSSPASPASPVAAAVGAGGAGGAGGGDATGDWFTEKELQSLRAVLGGRGCASIQRQLQQLLADWAGKVKRLLLEEESLLQDVKRACGAGGGGDVLRCARAVKRGEELMQTLRVMGAALQLGQLLLPEQQQQGNNTAVQQQQLLLSQVEINPQIWSLLPYAVSASLVGGGGGGDFWKAADVVTRLDAHANNAHLASLAVLAVLRRTQEPAGALAQREAEFIRSLALVLLSMKQQTTAAAAAVGEFKDWPLRGITLLVEKAVRQSSTLTPKLLDEVLPSPLVHCAVTDRMLGKVRGADAGRSVDELASEMALSDEFGGGGGDDARTGGGGGGSTMTSAAMGGSVDGGSGRAAAA